MSRLFTGIFLVIVTPLIYVVTVTFTLMPPPMTYEAFGDCVPVEDDYSGKGDPLLSKGELLCYDGLETVVNPLGITFAIVALGIMLFGLTIIGRAVYDRFTQRKNTTERNI